ncbi:MAG: hypothetical protein HC893_08730 [Chloroflexaceae bacterium]|nr:hypothetical protein [Chloroflexaceae bacterium]
MYSAIFSPDGRNILSGGEDRIVRVWDVASAEEVHPSACTSVAGIRAGLQP